jgi:hypothetical protein
VQRRAARRRPGVTLVDVRGAVGRVFLVREDVVSHDAFHPSDAGYGLIADALLPAALAALRPAPQRDRSGRSGMTTTTAGVAPTSVAVLSGEEPVAVTALDDTRRQRIGLARSDAVAQEAVG